VGGLAPDRCSARVEIQPGEHLADDKRRVQV
jgi:hypothetical protein